MRYAVISDIHGNLPALRAVIEDADRRGIKDFIIAGDYCLSGAWPDECITLLRSIGNKTVIRGNEERYLENLIGKDQKDWTDGQMQISYWCFRNISAENMDYLMSLPHTADIDDEGTKIHIAHASENFIGSTEFDRFGPAFLAGKYADTEFTTDMLKGFIHGTLDNDEIFHERVSSLEDGVYIFGHSHVQWSYRIGNVLLINPGSCGLPLDGIKDSIPYTILDTDGGISAEEIRLPFDKNAYISALKGSSQYREAIVWTKVIIKEQHTAREHLTFFLQSVNRYADEIGDKKRPFSVETWEKAHELWERSIL